MKLRTHTFVSLVLFALVAAASSSGCTVLLHDDKQQCTTDADCTKRGAAFARSICSVTDNVCVDSDIAGCTSNEKCTASNNGAPSICKKPGGPCVPVFTAECNTLIPHDAKMRDNAVLFAFTGLKSGSEAEAQKISYNIIEMGVNELNRSLVGLPGGPNNVPRPVIGLECDESQAEGEGEYDRLRRSYKHIIDDLGIQAIISNSYSTSVVNVVEPELTRPAGVFLMPNLSFSPLISTLDDNGLVWRSSSPTTVQAPAQAALVPIVEAKLRAGTNPPQGDIKVALLTSTGVVFSSSGDTVLNEIRFNNGKDAAQNKAQGNFQRFNHTSSNDDQNVDLAPTANDIAQFKPNIIVATNKGQDLWEAVEPRPKGIGPAVERLWTETRYRPFYIISPPSIERATAYLNTITDSVRREDLRQRIVAVDQSPPNATTYSNFIINYQAIYKNPKEDPVASGLNNYAVEYDGIYTMIYAMFAAAQKNPTLTGKSIAEGISRLTSGDPFYVGQTDTPQVKQRLASGQNVNLQGVYSLLDFDMSSGDSPTETSVVCLEKSTSAATGLEWKFSSMTWDRTQRTFPGGATASCLK
ncbi:hypothetical protein LVJ94_06110 [Pendulispora rubella]|uniref:Uncharacterized protein n=1 Tax=Pendulispora rubella TaxID=2741070 RepID=A0ABZ2LC85_9BACT